MEPSNEVHTLFITTFGPKDVRVTYQRLVTIVFKHQLKRNMEAYVEDMIIKSKETSNHLKDLQEMFDRLQFYITMLNTQNMFLILNLENS